jgi:hypothetical protein
MSPAAERCQEGSSAGRVDRSAVSQAVPNLLMLTNGAQRKTNHFPWEPGFPNMLEGAEEGLRIQRLEVRIL